MFIFEPGVAFWSIIAFCIVLIFIQKKVYPPIRKILDDRKRTIEDNLAKTEQDRQVAEKHRLNIEEQLRNVKLEEQRIISESREKAQKLYTDLEKKVLEEIRTLKMQKQTELTNLEDAFYQKTKEKFAGLIINGCEKVLKTTLSPELQQKIIEQRIEELKNAEL